MNKKLLRTAALVGFFALLSIAEGEILFDELPKVLQERFNSSDLDTWKPPEDVRKNFPYYLSGFDEEGRPVWILELGKWPVRRYLDQGGDWDVILTKHVDQILYHMYTYWGPKTNSDGERVKELYVLIDMDGYDLTQLSSPAAVTYLIKQLRLVSTVAHISAATMFINTNYFGEKILNIIRPVMGSGYAKFEIYGTNPKVWMPKLLKRIPSDQLPTWYGGSKNFKPVKVFG